MCRHALVRAPPRAVIVRGGSKLLTGTAPEARGDPSHLDQDGLSNSDRRSALAKPGAITARPRSPIRVVGATTRQSRAPPHRVRAGRPAPLGARFDRIC